MRTPLLVAALLIVVLPATLIGMLPATDALAALPDMRPAGPDVVVHLQSGRTLSGQVDPETDQREFVLRSSVGPGWIIRPIHWDRLVRAEIVGEQISGPELQRMVAEIRLGATPPKPIPPRGTLERNAEPQSAVAKEPRTPKAL